MYKRILLVEDDRYIALALKIRLLADDFSVDVAASVQEAVQLANEQPPDIVLIDYNLPDGDGFDVMRCFSSDRRTQSCACVFMTASKQSGLRDKALAAGALNYFEKPFKSVELLEFIQTLSASSGAA